jgi:hypothetical protein
VKPVVLASWIVAVAPVHASSPWRVVAPASATSSETPAPSGIRRPRETDADAADPRRREAARAFADGEAAFERGDFADAAERFGRAHALVPHPWTLYNHAVSLRQAGELVAAYRAFGQLAEIATTDEERAEAQREQDALGDRVAVVELRGPGSGSACIDDQRVRLGPDGRARWIGRPGTHRLITHEGARDFTANAGAPSQLDVAPRKRRAPRARGWLVAATIGSAGALGGGTAGAVLADGRGAKASAAVAAGAGGIALVASIVALALVERDAKRRAADPLPCELR